MVSNQSTKPTANTTITDLNGYINYTFNKYFSFKSTLGVDFNDQKANAFDDVITFNSRINGNGQPLGGIVTTGVNTMGLSNVLTFSNAAANSKHHDINVILGNEFYNLHTESMDNEFKLFPIGIDPVTAFNRGRMAMAASGGGEGATFHHNLLANHTSRNPRFSSSSTVPNPEDELVDFSNNVIFNWSSNSTYGGEKGRYNMLNNYYKPGPATTKTFNRILNPWAPLGQYYLSGNFLVGNKKVSADNWQGVEGQKGEAVGEAKVDQPFKTVPINLQPAQEAYRSVLAKAGANLHRDAADLRILQDVVTGSAREGSNHDGIIDSQKDVSGWPELKSLPAPVDTDHDGIPDEWERRHGLNPNDASDSSAYKLDKMYTNLEVYLNSLIPWN